MFGLSWLTAKLAAGIGGVLLILFILSGCYGQGRHAGELAQEKHDAPIIAAWKQATADWAHATADWAHIVSKQNADIAALKATQDAKVAQAERMTRAAVKARPRAQERSEHIVNAELSGTTLERFEQADRAVVNALR